MAAKLGIDLSLKIHMAAKANVEELKEVKELEKKAPKKARKKKQQD